MRWLTFTLLVVASAVVPSPQDLGFPTWVSGARCSVQDSQKVIVQSVGRRSDISCPGRGLVLSCDIQGAEPFDVPVTSGMRPRPPEPSTISALGS